MTQKSAAKRKRLAKADLNFISKQPFEQVLGQLRDLRSRQVKPCIMQVDDNTALFQLSFIRGDKTTAEVSGRLKRWAGDMTHIYCDGRAFQKSALVSYLWRWAIDVPGLIMLWIALLFLLSSDTDISASVPEKMLFTFLFALVFFGFFHLARMILKITLEALVPQTIQFRKQSRSKPAAKDRERLFHAITSIIRDDEIAENLLDGQSSAANPLTEEEEAALIELITTQTNAEKYI